MCKLAEVTKMEVLQICTQERKEEVQIGNTHTVREATVQITAMWR